MKKTFRILLFTVLLCCLLSIAAAAKGLPFADVKKKDWFYDSVSYVYENGMMSGTSATRFAPNENLTRAMFVTILGRLDGVKVNHKVATVFTDVKKGQYYTGYVKWGNDNGIVNGTTKTTFGPDENITREQMCALMVRYAKYAGVELKAVNKSVTFKDAAKISGYAKAAVKTCQRAGLVSGEAIEGGYNFRPTGNATRAEAAAIFERFDKTVKAQAKCPHTVKEQIIDRAATCGRDGLAHIKCTECGETLINNIALAAHGRHTPAEEVTVVTAPTCGESGIGKKVCSVCGKDAETGIVIPATGNHTPAEEVTTLIPATCGKDGVGVIKCTVCPATLESGVPLAATGEHLSFTETVEKEMKALQDGLKRYTCDEPTCDYSYTEVIPATKKIKILAVGNSFSINAMEYLWDICVDGGAEEVILGNLYIAGCSLDTHWSNIQNDKAAYAYYKNTEGKWVKTASTKLSTALTDEDWDVITVQQASGSSGKGDTYANLDNILQYLQNNKTNSKAKIYWHMTWAYQGNSTHSAFPDYDSNQMTMYNAIVGATKTHAMTNSAIAGVIPTGTAVQNLRTSYLGDTLTRDGYHLTYSEGYYVSALSWYAYLLGGDVDKVDWIPSEYAGVQSNLPTIRDAVKKALETPFAVTPSAYDDILDLRDMDNYIRVELNDIVGACYGSTSKSYPVMHPITDTARAPYFSATQIFTRDTLPVGSLLIIDEGYNYRPEGWVTKTDYPSSRPGKVSTRVVEVTEDWWGEYNYRGFNIEEAGGKLADENTADHLQIYIPREYDLSNMKLVELDVTVGAIYSSDYKSAPVMGLITTTARAPYFSATQIFTRETLPVGSIIVVDAGYNYRADGWYNATEYTTSRPAKVSTPTVVVDEAWWGEYNYRGFNIEEADGNVADENTATHLRIYVPKN